jgi:hypothetical protein
VPNEATADYEAVRRAVLDGARGDRDLGLALLMRRGLAAWIRAWSTCAAPPPPSAPPPPGDALALPPGVRGDVTRLLVTMALTTTQTEVQP